MYVGRRWKDWVEALARPAKPVVPTAGTLPEPLWKPALIIALIEPHEFVTSCRRGIAKYVLAPKDHRQQMYSRSREFKAPSLLRGFRLCQQPSALNPRSEPDHSKAAEHVTHIITAVPWEERP